MSNKTKSFAQNYAELQALTAEFETGDLDLEKAIPKFKRAAELAKLLKTRLTQLETQIEEINVDLEKNSPESPVSPADSSDDIDF